MTIFIFISGVILGVVIGRAYGWMKFHYPESKEMLGLKIDKIRAERARVQAQTEKFRADFDDSIYRRQSDGQG